MTQFYYLTAKTPLEPGNGVRGKGIRFGQALMRLGFILEKLRMCPFIYDCHFK